MSVNTDNGCTLEDIIETQSHNEPMKTIGVWRIWQSASKYRSSQHWKSECLVLL